MIVKLAQSEPCLARLAQYLVGPHPHLQVQSVKVLHSIMRCGGEQVVHIFQQLRNAFAMCIDSLVWEAIPILFNIFQLIGKQFWPGALISEDGILRLIEILEGIEFPPLFRETAAHLFSQALGAHPSRVDFWISRVKVAIFKLLAEFGVSAHSFVNKIAASDLSMISQIGMGATAMVWKAFYQGQPVAVKKFHPTSRPEQQTAIQDELITMSVLRHPHLVVALGVHLAGSETWIISKYFRHGDLAKMFEREYYYAPAWVVQLGVDCCSAMAYLHSVGVMHRDLKPENLLIDDAWHVSIADFGSSRGSLSQRRMTVSVGTPVYMAPEATIRDAPSNYTDSIDMYSFALVLWETIFVKKRGRAYSELEWYNLHNLVGQGTRPPLEFDPQTHQQDYAYSPREVEMTAFIMELIESAWSSDPEQRPTFDALADSFSTLQEDWISEHSDLIPIPLMKKS